MKLDLKVKTDFWTALIWIALCLMLVLVSIVLFRLNEKQIELNKLIEENRAYVFDYSCNGEFDSKWYNCPINESIRNITGNYCYGKAICENTIRRLK